MDITVRPPEAGDRDAWGRLYAGYADFYAVDQTEAMRDRVWDWLMTPAHEVEGRLALVEGAPVGLAHFRSFARPLAAATGLFLDDLFVASEARGSGAVQALMQAVHAEAARRDAGVVRWITAQDNGRARTVYDRLAEATRWVTYDMPV